MTLRPEDLFVSRLCVFLDFDGTLVPLAPTPDGITVPDDLTDLLARLHKRLDGRLCIVSGREIAVLDRFLPGFPGDVFGAHGAESRRDGVVARHPLVGSDVVAKAQQAAAQAVADVPGLLLETKDTGAVIHYRAAPDAEPAALAAAQAIVAASPGLDLHRSKMAFEIRPLDASKAAAVTAIMAQQPQGIVPVVIGDDVTDEEAMVAANALDGLCIRVGDGNTVATWRLPDPASVITLLRHWADSPRADTSGADA